MLAIKTKWFHKWCEKNAISDTTLLRAIENISANYGSVNLGAGLYKVRVAGITKGKRGGYRFLIVFKESDRAIFVYGFAKNEKDNLSKEELKYFKKLAKDLLSVDIPKYLEMIKLKIFISVGEGR